MWKKLTRFIYARRFKHAIDCIAEAQGSCRTAPQMGGDHHIRSGAWAVWQNNIGSQFELNDSSDRAVCQNAVESAPSLILNVGFEA
jgi:hypothetical protein